MPTFALFGDSYIKRLSNYCNGDLEVPGNVFFYGKGGLRTDRMVHGVWKRCLRREADVCFISIGGNDITTTSEPEDIYQRIVQLVDALYRHRVKMVYVAEIQTRGDFRGGLTKENFDNQRLAINSLLKERYGHYYVEFKDVRYPIDYDEDLVHLDSSEKHRRNSGMRKFKNRIRGIFCSYRHRM